MMDFVKGHRFETVTGILVLFCMVGLLSLCSETKPKPFLDSSKAFCDDLNSGVLFANQEKKMVVCQ